MILLPTLNRTALLTRFLESYKATSASCAGIILVDEADLLKNEKEYMRIKNSDLLPPDWVLRNTGKAVTMGDKVRFCWDEVKHMKWVGILNDDHVCITPNWDEKAEALLDGTNFISTNDGNFNFGINPVGLTAWSMPLLEAAGFPIFPGKMYHWFVDDTWKRIGEATGCWLETMKINIEHRHVFCSKMEPDDTFNISQGQEQAQYNQREFQHFMEQDFKGVCERVIKLRAEHISKEKFT